MKDFAHIHQVLTENGYPESHESEWYILIDDYQENRIIPHWFDCHTKARTKVAVRSLLTKTDVYSVVVYSPTRVPVTFSAGWGEINEHQWNYYYS